MSSKSLWIRETYDIIIAGGGTAGCALATRLSEVPELNILLLEAGGNQNENPLVQIPALVGQAIGDSNLDWNYYTVPQPALEGREMSLPRG